MLVTMAPIMSGMRMMPELVADLPCTPCTNSGRNMMAPNMAADCRALASAETLNTRFSKSRGLMIGSAARSSRKTKTTVMTAENTKSPMICHDTQGYSLPAQLKPSSSGTAAATSRAAPL